jgi:uncharacterized protein YndB with AHSA1/START domain
MQITVQTNINSSLAQVWECWTLPEHIVNWNFASDDWCCPAATSDLTVGSEFHYTMAAKDDSFSFDFWGTYDKIVFYKILSITLGDGRKLKVTFEAIGNGILLTESFEPESENPIEMQQAGWQQILENFKKYVEGLV